MRALSEILGRSVLVLATIWIGAVVLMPADLQPLVACQPLVWATRTLGELAGAAAGHSVQGADPSDALGGLAQGCMRTIGRYLRPGGGRP